MSRVLAARVLTLVARENHASESIVKIDTEKRKGSVGNRQCKVDLNSF